MIPCHINGQQKVQHVLSICISSRARDRFAGLGQPSCNLHLVWLTKWVIFVKHCVDCRLMPSVGGVTLKCKVDLCDKVGEQVATHCCIFCCTRCCWDRASCVEHDVMKPHSKLDMLWSFKQPFVLINQLQYLCQSGDGVMEAMGGSVLGRDNPPPLLQHLVNSGASLSKSSLEDEIPGKADPAPP